MTSKEELFDVCVPELLTEDWKAAFFIQWKGVSGEGKRIGGLRSLKSAVKLSRPQLKV